jgi:hypothetical protein
LLPADSGAQQSDAQQGDGGGGEPNGLPEFEKLGIIDRHSLQRTRWSPIEGSSIPTHRFSGLR